MEQRRTSPWVWVGVGCALCVLVAVSAMAVLGWLGVRKMRQFEAEMKDPELRAAKVVEVLGGGDLPAGYYPVFSFSVPWVFDLAVLSDEPPGEEGEEPEMGSRGFVYVGIRDFGSDRNQMRRYLRGEDTSAEALERTNLRLDVDQLIARGELPIDGVDHLWAAYRGRIETGEHGDAEGIQALVMIDCPQAKRLHLGILFGKDPDPEAPVDELDLTGTPADEQVLRDLLSQIRVCA